MYSNSNGYQEIIEDNTNNNTNAAGSHCLHVLKVNAKASPWLVLGTAVALLGSAYVGFVFLIPTLVAANKKFERCAPDLFPSLGKTHVLAFSGTLATLYGLPLGAGENSHSLIKTIMDHSFNHIDFLWKNDLNSFVMFNVAVTLSFMVGALVQQITNKVSDTCRPANTASVNSR